MILLFIYLFIFHSFFYVITYTGMRCSGYLSHLPFCWIAKKLGSWYC
uniref:Uncharacterized protein n=1 Tax=Arundo donax TaxID=35708 RepID=A0A0A9H457_ARUDO